MTQDQYGQARETSYVVHGEVAGDETDESADDQGKPMTRFQKVASALRGDRPDREEPDTEVRDQAPADQAETGPAAPDPYATAPYGAGPSGTDPDRADPNGTTPDPRGARPHGAVAATGAGARQGDYWDTPAASGTGEDQVAAVTSPDVPVTDTGANPLDRQDEHVSQYPADVVDPTPTQPDVYGTGGTGTPAAAGDQAGTATIPDVPVTQTPDGADLTEAPGGAGRHAAAPAQDAPGMRPGEAAGTLENLGDLAYGNLLPDASVYTEQWQQIQFKFVDDPQASVTEAADVVAQVTAKLEAAIQERQRAIEARQQAIQEQQRSLRGRWGEGSQADTETLRETLRMYKAFLDQLVGPKV